jgi:hypothetical protein
MIFIPPVPPDFVFGELKNFMAANVRDSGLRVYLVFLGLKIKTWN